MTNSTSVQRDVANIRAVLRRTGVVLNFECFNVSEAEEERARVAFLPRFRDIEPVLSSSARFVPPLPTDDGSR